MLSVRRETLVAAMVEMREQEKQVAIMMEKRNESFHGKIRVLS